MPIQACYALTDVPGGPYADMAFISATLLRRVHTDARIVILCDEATHAWLDAGESSLRAAVDRVIRIVTNATGGAQRSRLVKTAIREHVEGDFLYIDADAMVVRPIDAIAALPGEVIAAYDRAYEAPEPHAPLPHIQRDMDVFKWHAPQDGYFNAGVIYCRDTANTRAMWKLWSQRWHEYHRVIGKHFDQPSFNSVLHDFRRHVGVLPVKFNAIVEPCPWHARDAAVLHFLAGWTHQGSCIVLLLDHLLEHYKLTGEIDDGMIERCVRSNHPWVGRGSARRYWHTGHYGKAALQACRSLAHRLVGRTCEPPGRAPRLPMDGAKSAIERGVSA